MLWVKEMEARLWRDAGAFETDCRYRHFGAGTEWRRKDAVTAGRNMGHRHMEMIKVC